MNAHRPTMRRPLQLRTFGGLSVEAGGSDGPAISFAPRRLALIAVVAAAGARGITREKILGILWPESGEGQARHTLSQTLYLLRRDTGAAWITGTAQLRLDASVTSDVGQFLDALNTDQLDRAAVLYTGPFLEGFYLAGAPEFERWVEETRARLQFMAIKTLTTLARRAEDAAAFGEAAGWWRRLGEIDPFDATCAAGRIRALIAAGDQLGALRFAREYETLVRRELDAGPDAGIVELIGQLRSLHGPLAGSPSPLGASGAEAIGDDVTPPAPATAVNPDPPSRAERPDPAALRARSRRSRRMAALPVVGLITAAVAWQINEARLSPDAAPPVLAIGSIQARDTAAHGPMLRDMLATNLGGVRGIEVVSNSRLLELLPRDHEADPAATTDAARRAGASQIVEGELGITGGGLVLTLRRVALQSGRVRQGYTVRAADLYALTDSATAAIARDFQLDPPAGTATVRTRSAIAYALYEQGVRAFYQGDLPAASRLMSAALDRDSAFAMAAFFAWRSSNGMLRLEEANRLLPILQRLAAGAAEHERLRIEATIANQEAPAVQFLAIAREMTERFPGDPDGQILLGTALAGVGDWAASVDAYNRAIAIDSAAGVIGGPYCRACAAIDGLQSTYAWWDSTAAAQRAAARLLSFRPAEGTGWRAAVEPLLRLGRRAEAEAAIARAEKLSATRLNFQPWLDRDLIRSGRSDELEARLLSELRSTPPDLVGELPWLLAFSLRNQGRLQDARRLAAEGTVPGSTVTLEGHEDLVTLAILPLELGRPAESARRFLDMVADDRKGSLGPGPTARVTAWHMTLAATALAAAGDTAAVRALADSVARIGQRSSSGRDFKLHHFLRGLLLQHQDRHAEAVESFRRSLFSLTDGYTRTNLEMARSLMTLGRHTEAVAVLQPALRGGVDGSNSYVTHTELHEALALAFHAAGQPDSAAAHYAAVERAWRRADPGFAGRYRAARAGMTLR